MDSNPLKPASSFTVPNSFMLGTPFVVVSMRNISKSPTLMIAA
jgi:hypothetical protein